MTISKALQTVLDNRRAVHPNTVEDKGADFCCQTFTGERNGRFFYYGYVGRSTKPKTRWSFKSEGQRNQSRETFLNEYNANHARKLEKKAKAKVRIMAVGDVLRSSWGYEQTNIDYYMVTALSGKQSVYIVKIGKLDCSDGATSMTGRCVPDTSVIESQPTLKRADGDYISLNSYAGAFLKKPSATIGGVDIYEPDQYSSYA